MASCGLFPLSMALVVHRGVRCVLAPPPAAHDSRRRLRPRLWVVKDYDYASPLGSVVILSFGSAIVISPLEGLLFCSFPLAPFFFWSFFFLFVSLGLGAAPLDGWLRALTPVSLPLFLYFLHFVVEAAGRLRWPLLINITIFLFFLFFPRPRREAWCSLAPLPRAPPPGR